MLKVVGDVSLTDGFFDTGFGIGSSVRKAQNPFVHLRRNSSDLWLGNLECVIASHSNKKGFYRKQFIIAPQHLGHVRHLNIYGVANNHVMLHGSKAYQEMLDYIDLSGSLCVGANQRKSVFLEHQGRQIALSSFSQRKERFSKYPGYWYNPEYKEIEAEYRKIEDARFKILYVHWGNEYVNKPYNDQRRFAHWLIDLGFDIVIGVHPHVLQGYEVYNGKYIFYSIGNFVFNMPYEPACHSVILNLDFSGDCLSVKYDYVKIGKDFFPKIIPEGDVPRQYRFDYLNERLGTDEENEIYYSNVFSMIKKHRKSNYSEFLRSTFKFSLSDYLSILRDFVKRRAAEENGLNEESPDEIKPVFNMPAKVRSESQSSSSI
ncbi:MAG TPA: CapA family protein [Ignavibacteriales bacterium]|nr:CapA family protein [Ignavibacteriales bacterium]